MPTVGTTHFKYTPAGIKKAKAWAEMTGKTMQMDQNKSKVKKYQPGGKVSEDNTKVTSRVSADVLDPSSLQEVAHKPINGGSRQAVQYEARTKGGEKRHIIKDIEGVGGKQARREAVLRGLREAIRSNPSYGATPGDTVSIKVAKEFMDSRNEGVLDMLLEFLTGKQAPTEYQMGGAISRPNMSPGMPMQNRNLAAMGRRGDTMIRPVAGQPSHVTSKEANMIDNLGPVGQKMTQVKGAGTINPRTGLKEYHPAGAWWQMAHPQHHGSWWTGDTEAALSTVADVASDVGESIADTATDIWDYGGDVVSNIGEDISDAGDFWFGQGSMADTFWDWAYYGCVGEQIGDTCYMTDEEYELSQTLSGAQDVINEGLNMLTLAWGQGEGPLVWVDSGGNIQTGDPLGGVEGGITDLDNYEWAEGTPSACQGEMTPIKLQECYEAGGTDLTEQQLSDLQDQVDEYEDEFFEDLEEPSGEPEPTEVTMPKPLNVWGFSKFGGDKDSDWLDTLDKLLGKEKTAAKGGYIRKPKYQTGGQVSQGRKTYGSPMKYSMKKKKRPAQMQTSTAGMPSRPQQFRGGGMAAMRPGMNMTEPYLKSYRVGGSVPKGWHI